MSTKTSQLTFAHEIGHNFGSPHDFPSYCKPEDGKGNYIMFASATSGNKAYIVMKVEQVRVRPGPDPTLWTPPLFQSGPVGPTTFLKS